MRYNHGICWLRRDLRLHDHRALFEATHQARKVTLVFIFDTCLLHKLKNKADRRLTFIYEALAELNENLKKRDAAVQAYHGDPTALMPKIIKELGADAVFTNRDYEIYAKERDNVVARRLAADGCAFHTFKDQVIFESNELHTSQGKPFRVFTPYKNAWLKAVSEEILQEYQPDLKKLAPDKGKKMIPLQDLGFTETKLWLKPGETAARKRWHSFLAEIKSYHKQRDFPAAGATSGLSVHLRFGTISPRELVRGCYKGRSLGAKDWLSELIWRDFFMAVLQEFPHIEKGAFHQAYDCISWPNPPGHYEAWVNGQTGFPIVDAAMRLFNRTGWMHNRLRMVTASFLVKDLLVDWRLGERYFADNLLDFDLAANNGNWQWCASTGCDAQPYFRVFNPLLQAKKFDPDGVFIKNNLPELKKLPPRYIHEPHRAPLEVQSQSGCLIGKDYPAPIVDHALQKIKVLDLYRGVRKTFYSL